MEVGYSVSSGKVENKVEVKIITKNTEIRINENKIKIL